MEQKNTTAASMLQKKKTVSKWLQLLKPLSCLGIVLPGATFTGL